MNKNSFQDWVQILTGLALLIGLVLVVIEIRQSQTIALMEFTQAGYQEVFAFQRQRMGENPGPTLVKACLQPEQLTEEETDPRICYTIGPIKDRARAAEISGRYSARQVDTSLKSNVEKEYHGVMVYIGGHRTRAEALETARVR